MDIANSETERPESLGCLKRPSLTMPIVQAGGIKVIA